MMVIEGVVADWTDAERLELPPLVVLGPLAEYLDDAGLGHGDVKVRPIGDGHSNLTYEVVRGDTRLILRRPPRPPIPRSAHDVIREARIIQALEPMGVPVPHVVAICDDESVIGAPFALMDFIDGLILSDRVPASLQGAGSEPAIGMSLIDALARIHSVDIDDPSIAAFGRPVGYLERQVERFRAIWRERRTRDIAAMEEIGEWLTREIPDSAEQAVVHGDFRLGNIMFEPEPPVAVRAVLDWEMATLGDPLADLGYLLSAWAEPDDAPNPILQLSEVTRTEGFPQRSDLLEMYVSMTGRDVSAIGWYEVLATWKSAVFLEANYARYREGAADDDYYADMGSGVPQLIEAASSRIQSMN